MMFDPVTSTPSGYMTPAQAANTRSMIDLYNAANYLRQQSQEPIQRGAAGAGLPLGALARVVQGLVGGYESRTADKKYQDWMNAKASGYSSFPGTSSSGSGAPSSTPYAPSGTSMAPTDSRWAGGTPPLGWSPGTPTVPGSTITPEQDTMNRVIAMGPPKPPPVVAAAAPVLPYSE
jgi:hypothetical protein